MTNAAPIANEAQNIEKTRAACGNKSIPHNLLSDSDFDAVAKQRASDYREKASSVKSEEAKSKWVTLAEMWEQA